LTPLNGGEPPALEQGQPEQTLIKMHKNAVNPDDPVDPVVSQRIQMRAYMK